MSLLTITTTITTYTIGGAGLKTKREGRRETYPVGVPLYRCPCINFSKLLDSPSILNLKKDLKKEERVVQ